jgi:predicted nucleic acid-binding protein
MANNALVVDSNILVRAVLGKRVRAVIGEFAESASFFLPEAAYAEAEEHLPALVIKRGGDPEKALAVLRSLRSLMVPIGSDVYGEFETEARRRLAARDPEDWPILASAWRLSVQSGQRRRSKTVSSKCCSRRSVCRRESEHPIRATTHCIPA